MRRDTRRTAAKEHLSPPPTAFGPGSSYIGVPASSASPRPDMPMPVLFRNAVSLLALLILTLGVSLPSYGAGGDIIWQYGDARAGKQEAEAVAVDSQGSVIIAGFHVISGGDNEFFVAKLRSDGTDTVWTALYNRSGGDDEAVAVAVDSNNDVIVTGYEWNGGHYDIHTIKYSGGTGAVLWQSTFDGSARGNDLATAIAVDGLNNIYVAGYSQNTSGNEDYVVLKYSPSGPNPDGTPVRQAIFNGAANGADKTTSLTAGVDGIAVTGSSWNGTDFDFLTIKYDLNLSPLWEKRYSSSGTNNDGGSFVKMDSAGNVVVAGSASNGTNLDIYTVKYNGSNSTIIKEWTHNGGYDDEPRGLWIDSSGNIFITGYTWTLAGRYEFYTASYNASTGGVIWEQTYGSGGNNDDVAVATGIVVDQADNVFVTGFTYKAAEGNYDFQTLKYRKENGSALWQQSFDGAARKDDMPVGIVLTPSGEIIVAGWSDAWTAGASDYDYYAIKYDPGLLNAPTQLVAETLSNTEIRLSWTDNAANEDGFRIERKIGQDGTYAEITTTPSPLPANTVSYTDTGLSIDTKYYYRVMAFNAANGNSHYSNEASAFTRVVPYSPPSWSYTYNGADSSDDIAFAIAVGPDNNPVVTGMSFSNLGSFDYYTLKLDRSNGSKIWDARYNGDQDDLDVAVSVSVDGNNDAIASGYSTLYSPGAGTNTNDIYTLKYSAATGLPELWHDIYDGPTHNDDRSTAVATAVDGSNNVVVVGYGKNGVLPLIGTDDLYVIKYLPNGSRDWAATPYDGPGQGNDYPTAAVFDPAGNIFVSGYVSNSNNNYDFFTAKYCGSATAPCGGKSKGEIIWSKIHNGAGNGNDYAKALAVDPSGNVYVTGSVVTASGNEDFYTVKYNGATGDELWTGGRSFDGAGHGNDGTVSIEIDPLDGDIVVAGTSLTETGNNDFVVIKYHPNGDEVWTKPKTLYRPANDDYVVGMGMDLSGNVCVAGTTSNGATTDMMSVKLDYEGNTIGATLYNGTADNYDYAAAVAVNSLGEAFIAGYTRNASGNDDYVVYKCAWDSLQVAAPFAAVPGYTDVALTWSDNSTTELGYTLERKVGSCSPADTANTCEVGDAGCPWTWRHDIPLGTVPYTSYVDTGVNTGSDYCYRIHSYGGSGTASRYIGTPATTSIPVAPSGLTATAVNTSRIHLAWTDNTTNEEGFKIERCAGPGCVDFAEIAAAGGNSTTYDNIGLDPSTIYRYRVRSFSSSSWTSGFSNTAEATTTIGLPTGLLASVVNTTRVDLAWTDASVDETGFKIERCETAGCSNFAQIALAGTNATAYSDTTACSATAYTYRLRAANDGLSNGSGGCWTGRKPLTITNFHPDYQMKISVAYDPDMQPDFDDLRFYDETARVELPYWIEKKTDGVSATIWIRTGATNTIKMYYGNPNAIGVSNTANLGFVLIDQYPYIGWSDTRSSTCGSYRMMGGYNYFGTAASTQKTLSSLAAGDYAVTFNYYHVDSWETGESGRFFWNGVQQWSKTHVYSGTNVCGGGWGDSTGLGYGAATAAISHPGGDATLKFDSTLNEAATNESWGVDTIIVRKYTAPEPAATAGTEEQSACFAFGGTWNSAYTNESSVATQSAAAPVLTAARISEVQIDLSWTDGNADETGFKVWRCDGAGCDPDTNAAPLASIAAGATSYQDTDLIPSTVYRYLVKAYKTAPCNWEASSGIAEATTTITAPNGLTANAINTTRIDLSWTDNTASETGFRVERCAVGVDCPAFAPIATTGPSAPAYSDTSACDSRTYDYRVMAVNDGLSNSGGVPWTRHALLTIANFQPQFQTKVVISYDADMQPDFDDIRFYDETAMRELPYWIEAKTDGGSATVWFKTGNNNNITLYYGNASAMASGNGEAVFEFFDDFRGTVINTTKWTEIDPNGSISQNNDLVFSNVNNAWTKALISKQTFTRSADKRLSVQLSTVASTGGDYLMMGWELDQNTNASYTQLVHGLYFANYGFATYEKGGSYGSNVSGYAASTDYEIRFDLKATGAVYSIKGGSYANWTVVKDLSNYADSPMRLAFTQNTHPMKIHVVRVQKYASTEPTVALNAEIEELSGHIFSRSWNSGYSNEASAATAAPAAPDGFAATPLSESQLSLSWTDRTTDETGFSIERKAEACSSNSLSFIPIVPLADPFDAGINPELWSQRGVLRDAGTGVSQTVTVPPIDATDGNGTVRITPSSGAVELFTASTGGGTANNYSTSRLTLNTPGVIQGDFDATIDFALPDGEITASQYHVYARLLIYFPNTANGQNYAYVERTVSGTGNSYYGAVMVDGMSTGSGIPTSDTSGKLRIARTGSILSVYIWTGGAWSRLAEVAGASTAASNNLLIIQYAQRNEAAALKATIDNFSLAVSNANMTSLTDTGLNSGTTYCYRVKAYKTAACGWETAYTSTADATTLTPPPPTGLSAAPANTTQIGLSWTDNTGSETGFVVQRCTGAGCSDFADLATVGPNVTTYSDTSACASTTYQYRVRASKTTAPTFDTGYSNTATATPPGLGGSPTLTAVRASETQINLSWTDGNSDETGSRIDRCADADCSTVQQTFTVGQNVTSFNDTWLANGTTYYYRVHAYKAATCGWDAANSTIVSATTTVTAPSGLTAVSANTTQINLSWTDTSVSETGFALERCADSACGTVQRTLAVDRNTTTYQDASVCSATTYYYRTKAKSDGLTNSGGGCWTRRVPLTITDFQPNFLTRIVIPYAAAMQPDFDDIRFYDMTHIRELPHWIENKTDGISATVWVKTGDNNALYLYYGNAGATSAGSMSGVFGSGLMGFWQFNEPSGTISGVTADGSGQGNDGTLYNFADPFGIVGSGRFGNALSLNGSNNYVRRDTTNLPTGSVATLEAWVYPKAYGDATYNGIVSWGSRSCNGRAMLLSMQNSGMPSMATWCNDFTPSTGAAGTLNAWNHIAVVLNGKSVTLYMNGQPVSGTLTYTPSIQQNSLAIGSTDFPGRYFNGMIDEVRIYNRALSAAEIGSRYAATDPSAALGTEEQSACFTFANAFDSPYSATASAATPTPAAPVLSVSRNSEVQIDLSWTNSTTDETGYRIFRCAGSGCTPADPPIATIGANVTSYNDSDLAPETLYRYQVKAYKTAGCGWEQASNTAEATSTITAPGSLTATASNTTRIDLSWADNSGSETGFKVERCAGSACSDFAAIATVNANTTTYSDSSACNSTAYNYRVRATDEGLSNGNGACWTKRTPLAISDFQPDYPTRLTVSYDADMQPDFDDIRFYDGTTGRERPYWIESKTDGVSATVWVKTGSNNTLYLYYGNAGASSTSSGPDTFEFFDDFRGTTIDTVKWAEIDPDNSISQNNDLVLNDVSESWTKALISKKTFSRASDKKIYLKLTIPADTAGNNHFMIGWEANQTTDPNYTHLVHGFYWNNYLLSTYEKGSHTGPNTQSYAASTNYEMKIELKNAGAKYFIRGGAYANWTQVLDTTTYTDTALRLAFTQYSHQVNIHVIAVQKYAPVEPSVGFGPEESSGCYTYPVTWDGPYSNESAATTSAPTAPGGLAATAVTDTVESLTWTDTTGDETGFTVERCTGTGCIDFSPIGSTGASINTYSDASREPSTTYCYRVKTYKSASCGWETAYSNTACDMTFSATPSGLTATAINSMKIGLAWEDNSSDEDGFEIEVMAWNGRWIKTATVGPNIHAYIDTIGIEPNTPYVYRVRAFRGADQSPYSNEALVTYTKDGNTINTTPAYIPGDNTCQYALTVITAGPGTVTRSPEGVSCGTGCAAYCQGASVILRARPEDGKTFNGWGGVCAGTAACTLTIDGDKQVTAGFQ